VIGRWSVRGRITLVASGVFAIALGIASFALIHTVRDNLVDEIRQTDRAQLVAIANQLHRGVPPRQVQLPSLPARGLPVVRAVGPGGQVVELPRDERVPAGAVDGRPLAPARGRERIQVRTTVDAPGGRITLIAQRSLAEVDETVDNITDALWIGGPVLVGLVGLLAWYLAGRALRPVEAIRTEAAAITASTIHRRVPMPRSDDEVGRLARTMNEMLDRLEDASDRQRRFVSDASHELRSPLASIRSQLEVALRRPNQTNWSAVARRVLEEDARLELAVSELVELARLDEHGEGAELADVDLDELVLEDATLPRRVPVDVSRVSAGRVHGRAEQLARAVRNVVDNAGRHARSAVTVTLADEDGTVTLVVDDDGPGIPVDDRRRVFERFTRLDEGRARDAGGMGLGLSVVKAIVERHRGTVEVEDAPGGGARVMIRLPAASPR
jgi:signal transduction histidine kinase